MFIYVCSSFIILHYQPFENENVLDAESISMTDLPSHPKSVLFCLYFSLFFKPSSVKIHIPEHVDGLFAFELGCLAQEQGIILQFYGVMAWVSGGVDKHSFSTSHRPLPQGTRVNICHLIIIEYCFQARMHVRYILFICLFIIQGFQISFC